MVTVISHGVGIILQGVGENRFTQTNQDEHRPEHPGRHFEGAGTSGCRIIGRRRHQGNFVDPTRLGGRKEKVPVEVAHSNRVLKLCTNRTQSKRIRRRQDAFTFTVIF